jgi:hypothetical protein
MWGVLELKCFLSLFFFLSLFVFPKKKTHPPPPPAGFKENLEQKKINHVNGKKQHAKVGKLGKGKRKTTDEEKKCVTPIKRQMGEKMIVTKYRKKNNRQIHPGDMSCSIEIWRKADNLEYNILNTYDTCISCFCFGSNKECH